VKIGKEVERKQSSASSDDPRRIATSMRVRRNRVPMRIVAQPTWSGENNGHQIAKFPRMSTFKDDSLPQIINYCRLTSINVNCRFASAMRIV